MEITVAMQVELNTVAGTINNPLVIETNLDVDEKAIIKAGRKERKEHPENFTPWASVKAELAGK